MILNIIILITTNIVSLLLLSIIFYIIKVKKLISILILVLLSTIGFISSLFYLFTSKYSAIKSVNGKIITIPKNELECWIIKIVQKQSKILNIKTPQVAIYPSLDVNAFATGYNSNSSLVSISSELLKTMKRKQIEAVIGHEISHIYNGDMVTMILLQGIFNTFIIFASDLLVDVMSNFFYSINENKKNQEIDYIIYLYSSMISKIFFGLSYIIIMWFSRIREFKADVCSAKITSFEKMISALRVLQKNKNIKLNTKNEHLNTFYIKNNYVNIFNNLFMSHPTTEERIKHLIKVNKQINKFIIK